MNHSSCPRMVGSLLFLYCIYFYSQRRLNSSRIALFLDSSHLALVWSTIYMESARLFRKYIG
uniref:Uncharacterized protein n=1 Tax=Lepeophtheirus salmonis TaxID=72036 RepID=A0A0K2UZU0_LEPSM